jgi:hypothetical protein
MAKITTRELFSSSGLLRTHTRPPDMDWQVPWAVTPCGSERKRGTNRGRKRKHLGATDAARAFEREA